MDLYFQGVAFANRGTTPEYMTQARNFFERALAIDPNCIEALVGRANVDETIASALLTEDDPVPRLAALNYNGAIGHHLREQDSP